MEHLLLIDVRGRLVFDSLISVVNKEEGYEGERTTAPRHTKTMERPDAGTREAT
jgi:hypothetical protein